MQKNKELQNFFKKGYGSISKSIMTDSTLSLESKAIFAYFCALAGSGNKTFPFRSTIIKQLDMSKNTYYKHYNALINMGLISAVKASSLLSPNIYTININQKDKKGYGIISREIMQDDRLSLKAKGLYAYICSLSGKNNNAFPSKRQILKQLRISEPTYYNCLNQLKECGYVFTKQRKVLGRFSINDYYLYSLPNSIPDNESPDDTPNPKICDTPNPNIWDIKNRDTYLTTKFFSNNNMSIIDEKNDNLLQDTAIKQINKFFPDESRSKILNDFLPKFREKIKKKDIYNLPSYMKTSISNFLKENSVKSSFSRNSSYDLAEIEEMICRGIY